MEKKKRAREEVAKEVTIVSDVDAHSQCKMGSASKRIRSLRLEAILRTLKARAS